MGSVPTYPAVESSRIMSSPARAVTEPAPGGFMSVLRHRDFNDIDEGVMMLVPPEKKITQEEQDAIDEKARKRAMKNLVNSWQERLQLISVITTFFASTEAAMLVNTKPLTLEDFKNSALQASNACLLGSLIVHVYAAILSFLGAFLLIRYKLKEATREEMIAEGLVNSPLAASVFRDVERAATVDVGLQQTLTNTLIDTQKTVNTPEQKKRKGSYPVEPPIISTNPHIEQVGPFMGNVSSHLLSRTHALCVFLAAVGFILAIIGVMCYAWASQPRAVSVFASTCLGAAVVSMIILLI